MHSLLHLLFSILLAANLSNAVFMESQQLRSEVVGDFEGLIRSDFSRQRKNGTALDCQLQCLKDEECMSFFYNRHSGTCQTHDVVFFNPNDGLNSPGSQYYRQAQDVCPSHLGYIFNRALDFCYKIQHLSVGNHSYASHVCSNEGGRLVTADTLGKLHHLGRTINASKLTLPTGFDFLVGVTYNDAEELWRWSDGQVLDSASWCPHQPNYIGTAYYAMLQNKSPSFNGCLNDIPAGYINHFICEIFM